MHTGSPHWHIEHTVLHPDQPEPTNLLRLEYDGNVIHDKDAQMILTHFTQSLHSLGLRDSAMAVALEPSAIRVVTRSAKAAHAVVFAVQNGQLKPPPHPKSSSSSSSYALTIGIIAGVVVLLAFVAMIAYRKTSSSSSSSSTLPFSSSSSSYHHHSSSSSKKPTLTSTISPSKYDLRMA